MAGDFQGRLAHLWGKRSAGSGVKPLTDVRRCGECEGTGRCPLSAAHQRTLDTVRALHGEGRPAPTTEEVRTALRVGWQDSVRGTALNQRLGALVAWGLLVRGPRCGRALTWRAA